MPIQSTMGLKKIYVAPALADGTMPENGSEWVDLGDVYQDTCTLTDDDQEITEHKSETSKRKITLVGETVTNIALSLMDPDIEQLARYFGGSVSGNTPGSRTWNRPRKLPYKEWAIKMLPEEGCMVECANVRIIPKFEITYSAKGICIVPMTIKIQDELKFNEDADDDPTTT